jgi:hypothetical protein
VHSDLAVVTVDDTAATAQDQRELIGNILPAGHRELCAARGDITYDTAQRRRPSFKIDLSKIMNFEAWALAQFAKPIPRLKETHFALQP